MGKKYFIVNALRKPKILIHVFVNELFLILFSFGAEHVIGIDSIILVSTENVYKHIDSSVEQRPMRKTACSHGSL